MALRPGREVPEAEFTINTEHSVKGHSPIQHVIERHTGAQQIGCGLYRFRQY